MCAYLALCVCVELSNIRWNSSCVRDRFFPSCFFFLLHWPCLGSYEFMYKSPWIKLPAATSLDSCAQKIIWMLNLGLGLNRSASILLSLLCVGYFHMLVFPLQRKCVGTCGDRGEQATALLIRERCSLLVLINLYCMTDRFVDPVWFIIHLHVQVPLGCFYWAVLMSASVTRSKKLSASQWECWVFVHILYWFL